MRPEKAATMNDDLKKALEAGVRDAETLHRKADELNKSLTEVEAVIAQLKLGVSGRVAMGNLADQRFLAWGKDGNRWRLLYEQGDTYELITSAPRNVRMEAVNYLPKLVEMLITNVSAEVDKVEAAIASVDEVVDEVALHHAKENAKARGGK